WEYIEGIDLETALQQRDPSARAILTRDLTRHVHALHALGLVHGAIKPGNVIVTDQGLKLIDFSPLLFTDPAEDLTALRKIVEKISPEVTSVPDRDRPAIGIRVRAIFAAIFV